MRVAELTPGQTVRWVVTGSYLAPIADKQGWTGATTRFAISEEGVRTQVLRGALIGDAGRTLGDGPRVFAF